MGTTIRFRRRYATTKRYLEEVIADPKRPDKMRMTAAQSLIAICAADDAARGREDRRERAEKTEQKRKLSHEERIIRYLQDTPNDSALQSRVLDDVEGKRTYKIDAIESLKIAGVLSVTGKKQSPTGPLKLHLNRHSLRINDFVAKP